MLPGAAEEGTNTCYSSGDRILSQRLLGICACLCNAAPFFNMAARGSFPCYSRTFLGATSSSHAVQANFVNPGVQVTNYHVLANIFRQLRPDQLKGQGRPLVAKLTLLGALCA